MSKKLYRSYKPVTATDGILTWIKDTFDNTVAWTPDDSEQFISNITALSPNARITRIQAYLDNLENVTPAIKIHADAIRAIYTELENHFNIDKEGIHKLDHAEELWEKIIILRDVMPKAAQGVAQSKRMSDIASRTRSIIPVIAKKLVKNYPGSQTVELWRRLYSELEDRGFDPMIETDRKGYELYRYFTNKSDDCRTTTSIGFQSFANSLSKSRK